MSNEQVIHQLDARRLLCPMPVIRVQQLIEELGVKAVGERVEVVCTDPGVLYDIPAWANVHGHKLINTHDEDYEYTVVIEIGKD
jgi:tRNA 2-thiouridine synthesizing protein A